MYAIDFYYANHPQEKKHKNMVVLREIKAGEQYTLPSYYPYTGKEETAEQDGYIEIADDKRENHVKGIGFFISKQEFADQFKILTKFNSASKKHKAGEEFIAKNTYVSTGSEGPIDATVRGGGLSERQQYLDMGRAERQRQEREQRYVPPGYGGGGSK